MAERRLVGRPAAGGFACGPLAPLGAAWPPPSASPATPDEERARLSAAIAAALGQLEALLGEAEGDGADILAFQVAMLEDPELADPAFAALDRGGAAEAVWDAALGRQLADYEASDNPHFRARASDLADIRDRVLATLAGAAPDAAVAARLDRAGARSLALALSRRPTGAAAAPSRSTPAARMAMSPRSPARAACR